MDQRDTQAVTKAADDRPRYEPMSGSSTCRNCGTGHSTHLREKTGLQRVLCAESYLRIADGNR